MDEYNHNIIILYTILLRASSEKHTRHRIINTATAE